MSYLQKIRAENLKQCNNVMNFLKEKAIDLNNLPKIQYRPPPPPPPPPIPIQIANPNSSLNEGQREDSDDSSGADFVQYLRAKKQTEQLVQKPAVNYERYQREIVPKKKERDSNESTFNIDKYRFDNDNASESEQNENLPNIKFKHERFEKAPIRLKIQTMNSRLIPIDYEDIKDKIKIEDILTKQGPLQINYIKANNSEWQNFKKKQDYRLYSVLSHFPKIKEFKNNQKGIIKCGLQNHNVFVCMPTGGGKSLTFQILTFIVKGVYLCVLPLVSLIFDQQSQAKMIGIQAYSITANTQPAQIRQIYQKLNNFWESQNSIVLFCTPEKLNLSQQFSDLLQNIYNRGQLKRFIIDEVHCVSTWGKDFRVQYQNLSNLKKRYPKTPILALTATVTEVVKQDIITRLGIEGCYYFQSSFNRPNLYYQVRNKDKNVLDDIQEIINRYKNKSGIIYCLSRRDCEQMCDKLNRRGRRTAFYHSDINESEKKYIQEQWMENEINIIIATIAFGMGINKPDVRFVIHHTMSKSLQNYYQESGRAGRDGEFSQCILFYRRQDKQFLQTVNFKNQFSTLARKQFSTKQLAQMIKYCQEKVTCRRQFQLRYLGEVDFDPKVCNKTCDNCKRGVVYREYECIFEGRIMIKSLLKLQGGRVNLSKNQFIDLIRDKGQKSLKYKMAQIERLGIDLMQIRQAFNSWKALEIESLILQFMSVQILTQKVVKNQFIKNNKQNQVINAYIKCDIPKCKAFIQRVQTLPLRRNITTHLASKQESNAQVNYSDEGDTQDIQIDSNSVSHSSVRQDNVEIDAESERLKAQRYEKYKYFLQQIFEQDGDTNQ